MSLSDIVLEEIFGQKRCAGGGGGGGGLEAVSTSHPSVYAALTQL